MTETASNALPGVVLLDREEMLAKLSVSDSTLRRRVDKGVLPKPIEFGGPYCLRWIEAEVDEAIAAMPRSEAKPAPAAGDADESSLGENRAP